MPDRGHGDRAACPPWFSCTARRHPTPPGIFVLFDGMALFTKRLELTGDAGQPKVRERSDSPAYKSYEDLLDALSFVGRVRWFGRPI